ncbi:MAG TPA: ACP phosphodiesterase, partial [Prolixibacteraceae bacterium]|nr:ACP phosphodiesterase [Prolixibacteraceae bacterium]
HRRLQSYATIDGIETSMRIMTLHTSLPDHTNKGIVLLKNNYQQIEKEAIAFIHEATQEFLT